MGSTREAVPSDAAAIAAIYNQAVTGSTATFDVDPQSAEERAAWLGDHGPEWPVVVAVSGEAIVAWGSLSRWSGRSAYDATAELSIYIDEAHHGQGLGTMLGRELLQRAAGTGKHVVISRICTENTASVRLTERLGFELVGVLHEVGRKFGRWLDVVIFEKKL